VARKTTRFALGNKTLLVTVRAAMTVAFRSSLLVLMLCGVAGRARAEITLAPLFTDRVVLQRDKVVPIWGKATAREKVTLTFAGQTRQATPGPDGHWLVFLDPMPAQNEGGELVVTGSNNITLRDVVVGEVWLCSGQSNMEWPVSRAADAVKEIAAANFPLVRHVRIEHVVADTPAETVATGAGWQTSSPETVGGFTAVGYFFARELHQKLGVPIGLVHSSWGGTPVESWMSPAALAENPAFRTVTTRWQQTLADYDARKAAYDRELAEWTRAEAEAKASPAVNPTVAPKTKGGGPTRMDPVAAHREWLRLHPRPRSPRGPGDPWTPSGLFNGMINPLLPYALRGMLWYQGESNAERAPEYHALFETMITSWRAHFAQGDLPFYWVNLANFEVPGDATKRTYAFLREAQTKTLAIPNTGQALAIDIGDPKDIHPTNKQEVARRLALLAKNRVYGLTIDDTGPVFAGATRQGAAMRVRFTHASGGLVAHDKPPQALELAGADRVFHPADGAIERDMLVVTSTRVREPLAVRYAWTNAPEANLYNGAGLPAVPFRSDDW
jgi:sialate O-acetylesterase